MSILYHNRNAVRSSYKRDGRLWTDWDLSDEGREQAKRIGEKMAEEFQGWKFVMYSSDLKRARQTAEIVGTHIGVKPVLVKELRERNLGKCVGKSVQWLKENIIIVSHGDLLSVFNAMFLGLDVESLNHAELFGLAGGVSRMFENNEGKHFLKKLSDMSYIQ